MSISTIFFDGFVSLPVVSLLSIFGVGFLASILVILAFVPQNQFTLDWQLLRSASFYAIGAKVIVAGSVIAFGLLMIAMGAHDLVTLIVGLAALAVLVIGLLMTLSMWIWQWDSLTAFMFVFCLMGCWAVVAWGVQKLTLAVA